MQLSVQSASVLSERGYGDDTELGNWRNPDAADFIGIDPQTGRKLIAEFKLTLSSRIRPALMNQAISSLLRKKEQFPNVITLLIVSSPLPEVWANTALTSGISTVWDLPRLLLEASQTSVFAELQSFLNDVGVGDLGTRSDVPGTIADFPGPNQLSEPEMKGDQLCVQINEVPVGRAGWAEFEKLCTKALIHLFGDQFGSWHTQSQTDDGFHRRDFLVRLRPKHDFWISLAHDFRTRYIVFEYKNYEEMIGQNEIYSTEKYLFVTALRSVCFIIARHGASVGAYRAASGALREAGKLIIIITLSDLFEMLRAADRGEEPEILLYALLDQILTRMLR
jgi:hypothetical protein